MDTPTKEHAKLLESICGVMSRSDLHTVCFGNAKRARNITDAMDYVRQAVPIDAKRLLVVATADGEPVVLLTSANSNVEEMLEISNNRDESVMGSTRRSKLMGGSN